MNFDNSEENTLFELRLYLPTLKEYNTDIANDLYKIFCQRKKRFKDVISLDELSLLDRHISSLKPIIMPTKIKYKVYIFCSVEIISLIALDISEEEVYKIQEIFTDKEVFEINHECVSTLYLFQNNKIIFQTDLTSSSLSTITRYFENKNLMMPYDITKYEYDSYYDIFGLNL